MYPSSLHFNLEVLSGLDRIYDRTIKPIPDHPPPSLRYRVDTLLGLTGVRMAKYRMTLANAFLEPIKLVWRPQILGILIFEAALFGFSIGINVRPLHTCAVKIQTDCVYTR